MLSLSSFPRYILSLLSQNHTNSIIIRKCSGILKWTQNTLKLIVRFGSTSLSKCLPLCITLYWNLLSRIYNLPRTDLMLWNFDCGLRSCCAYCWWLWMDEERRACCCSCHCRILLEVNVDADETTAAVAWFPCWFGSWWYLVVLPLLWWCKVVSVGAAVTAETGPMFVAGTIMNLLAELFVSRFCLIAVPAPGPIPAPVFVDAPAVRWSVLAATSAAAAAGLL